MEGMIFIERNPFDSLPKLTKIVIAGNEAFKIVGKIGSAAHSYAKEAAFPFEEME